MRAYSTLPDFDCGSFTLHEEMISEDFTETTFYNQQGEVDHLQFHATFLGEITNSATGETFRDHAAFRGSSEGDVTIVSGLGFNVVRQGEGAVFQHIGRRLEFSDGSVVVLAGPDDVQGDVQGSVCVALA
jgi:hypothetical protein